MMQTQLIRNGNPVSLRWGWWHIVSLNDMFRSEGNIGSILTPSEYTFKRSHFVIDPDDGECFVVMRGDHFVAWR